MNKKSKIYLALFILNTLYILSGFVQIVQNFYTWDLANKIAGVLVFIGFILLDLFLLKKFKFHKMHTKPIKSVEIQTSQIKNMNENTNKHISEKNITFKANLSKSWTLLDDRIIYENDEILLSDIQVVHLISLSETGKKGVIEIKLKDKKTIHLAYPNKLKQEGEKAFIYIYDNSSCYKDSTRKHMRDVLVDINHLSYDNIGTSQFIVRLPNMLSVDEHIRALESCSANDRIGIIVCTNKRVLVVGMYSLIDIPLYKINSISYSRDGLYGTISITDGATTRTIKRISSSSLSFFTNRVNKEISNYNKPNTSTISPIKQVINTSSCADELIKFKQLLDAGALTQEEFDIKKKELLKL